MSTLVLKRPALKTLTLDVVLCAAAAAVPTLSHAAALPFYLFDPMRLLLFGAILFSSRRNALAMALGLPLLAMLTSGHPAFPKVLLIQGELVLNTLLFFALFRGSNRFFTAALVSVVAAKAAYYFAKYLMIRTALLDGELIATSWTYQLATLAFILVAGSLIGLRRERGRTSSS